MRPGEVSRPSDAMSRGSGWALCDQGRAVAPWGQERPLGSRERLRARKCSVRTH